MKTIFSYHLLLFVAILLLLNNCKKEELVTISIKEITNVTNSSANVKAEISASSCNFTECGVCWSTNPEPTVSDHKAPTANGLEVFTSFVTDLEPATIYYAKAYVRNGAFISYSSQSTFTTKALLPTLTTSVVTSSTSTTAVSGGIISANGGAAVIARGICWSSTTFSPTIANDKTSNGAGDGSFISNLGGLAPHTIYYIRAYATNSSGTGYGNVVEFYTSISGSDDRIIFNPNLTYGIVTDVEGNLYKTIQIGTQTWMAENLKTTKYRNGDPIPNVPITGASTGAYCWYNNDAATYKTNYGALYNWLAVKDSRNLAPAGWHIPTDEEWTILTDFLGGTNVSGGKLKESGITHWLSPNTGATNESGFTALPAGRVEGKFSEFAYFGGWWSSTGYGGTDTWHYELIYNYNSILRIRYPIRFNEGYSVRCVKD